MQQRFSAILCDIDGCLGPESSAPMDTAALAHVAAWNRDAIEHRTLPVLTVCSGRPQPYAEAMCRIVGNSVLPCVAEMGVWIYDPRDNTFHMDPAILPVHRVAVRDATAWIERTLVPKGAVIQPGKSASISLWHPDTPTLFALKPAILEHFVMAGLPLRVSSSVAWINCDLSHISKGSGIDRLAARCALRKENLAGIGDTSSDLCIRERVAFFACPANADPALKARADYVSPRTDIAGVLDILGVIAERSGVARTMLR